MSLPLSSQQDLYNLALNTIQGKVPSLTDSSDGSILDGICGAFSIAGIELQRQTSLQFNKTFFNLALGPDENGGGNDDLQTLAVDHFGNAFERPQAVAAIDAAYFSRPNNSNGSITILAGSIIKTQPDANGNVQRYSTNSQVILTNVGALTFTIAAASATTGAVYSDANSNLYTVTVTISGGTSLSVSGSTLPPSSGILTKVSGTGSATLTYSIVYAPDTYQSVGVTAVVAGAAGDAVAGTINVIETSLLDSSIVVTNYGNASGEDAQDSATYRETIRNLIVSLRAATKAAIQSVALTVAGITVATAIETELPVIQYNIATAAISIGATYFYIPFVKLYIFTASGAPNSALIAEVQSAINSIRAFGVQIQVVAANPVTVNWTAHIVLNSSGPNYALFSSNPSQIIAAMTNYIATLPTATNFTIANANAAMMALYGPSGTNDLTAFTTNIPTGDISIGDGYNALPGTVGLD